VEIMNESYRRSLVLIGLLVLAGLWGCDNSDDFNFSDADIQAEVEAAAEIAAMSGPTAEAASELILAMMGQVNGVVAPFSTGTLPTHTTEFDLGNGITGICVTDGNGLYTLDFGGSIEVEGAVTTLEGRLVVTPSVDQPATGSRYQIDFSTTAIGPHGTASWSSVGTVTLDEIGEVVDFDFTISHTVSTGAVTVAATAVVSPTSFELVVNGPLGGTVRFALDRETMTGTISLNRREVATVAIIDGCAVVNFLNDAIQDGTLCPQV
jgi:hypothetical protein